MNKKSTAILLFSRTALEEQASKTFSYRLGKKGNQKIAQCLIQNTISEAKKTKLPTFTCFSTDQIGDSFGQRISNAIEKIFAKGFEKVITIGNDCPDLTSKQLIEAEEQLEEKDMILGPTLDGGVYLIGINKKAFNKAAFVELPWECSELSEAFKKYKSDFSLESKWLNEFKDINSAKALKKVIGRINILSSLLLKIKVLLSCKLKLNLSFRLLLIDFRIYRHLSLRAPPLV